MEVVNDTSDPVDYTISAGPCNRNLLAGHYEAAAVSGTVTFYKMGGDCKADKIAEVEGVLGDEIVLLTIEGGNKKAKRIQKN